jgi:hypothetical protein
MDRASHCICAHLASERSHQRDTEFERRSSSARRHELAIDDDRSIGLDIG